MEKKKTLRQLKNLLPKACAWMLVFTAALLVSCDSGTEVPTIPQETAASETVLPIQERVYPLSYCTSGEDHIFTSNTSKITVCEDSQDPSRMALCFDSQPLSQMFRLYLRVSELELTRDMEDLTLKMDFFQTGEDADFCFRILFSCDEGRTWTVLSDAGYPVPTEESFSSEQTVMRLTVGDIQKQIPEGTTVTDLKLEPFSDRTGNVGSFCLLRASISYLAGPEKLAEQKTELVTDWFDTEGSLAGELTGTVSGETAAARRYLAEKDTLAMTAGVFITNDHLNPQVTLRLLVPEGEQPVLPGILYSVNGNDWIGYLDGEIGKQENVFAAADNTQYEIYEITTAIPRMTGNVKKIKWVFPMKEQAAKQELCILNAEVNFYTRRDDGPMLQKMIDDAKAAGQNEVVIPAINPATGKPGYDIGTTVWLTSDTTLILDGCYMRLNDEAKCNIFASLGAWSASNDPVLIAGQKNIRILGRNGATFDGGKSNGMTEKTLKSGESMFWNNFVLMRNVDGFEISGIKAMNARYWCFNFLYARNGSIHDIEFDCQNEKPNQDGIDLRQGCHNIDIYNLTGVTGDDTVALTAVGKKDAWYTVQGIEDNDIHDVTIRNVRAGCSGGYGVIRLLAQDGYKVCNISISDVYDTSLEGKGLACGGLIRVGDVRYYSVTPQAYGDIHGITIENVVSGAGIAAIYVNNQNITSEHITWNNITAEKGEILWTGNESAFYVNH